MLSIIITTYKESKTLKKSLDIILNEIEKEGEILIVGPDEETEKVARKYAEYHPQIRYLKDQGKGKPAALNLVFENLSRQLTSQPTSPGISATDSSGAPELEEKDILILTDGDVWPSKGFLKNLLKPFTQTNGVRPEVLSGQASRRVVIGAVTGRPISISPRNTMLGYWSHLLTEAAHRRRSKLSRENKYLDCSGYLYALKKFLIFNFQFSNSVLSEDAVISEHIWQSGYRIAYASEVKVYIKYPDNFKDWILQKRRSAGGYLQKSKVRNQKSKVKKEWSVKRSEAEFDRMRTFLKEIFYGTWFALTYPKNLKEFWWTILLFGARLYLWLLIFWDHKILRKKFEGGWERIESTKSKI
jgi:cellulose synthase/poly-beta-1,6-N-acetylglucosamine synthase-like glycosyltransferase